jgi:hypothetical protein
MVKGKDAPVSGAQGDPCKPLSKQGVEIKAGLPVIPKNPDIRYIFVSPPKFTVGTTVPEPVYMQLLDYPGAISKFFEQAISDFDGDIDALLSAAAVFAVERKQARKDTPIRNAVGRVSKAADMKLKMIEDALTGIRGISRAKVLAGLIRLKLTNDSHWFHILNFFPSGDAILPGVPLRLTLALIVPTIVCAQTSYEKQAAQERKDYSTNMTESCVEDDGSHAVVLDVMDRGNTTLVLLATMSPWIKEEVDNWNRGNVVNWRAKGFKKIMFVHMATKDDDPATIHPVGKGRMCYFAVFTMKPR